jgi:hypothetical protein
MIDATVRIGSVITTIGNGGDDGTPDRRHDGLRRRLPHRLWRERQERQNPPLWARAARIWPIIYANLILTDVEQVAIAATVREDISGTGFLDLLTMIFPVGLTVLFAAGLVGGVLGVIGLFVVMCWRERALHA